MSDDDSRPANDLGVRRRDLMALGAAATIGTGLGVTTTSALGAQEGDAAEATGLFIAPLTGDQQTDPVETDATGGAVFSVSADGDELEYALLVNAIENADQAHIHLGSFGEVGPVVVWLYPDPDANEPELQEGRFDGVLATGTITDENVSDELDGPSVEALVEEITAGNTYVNVHTTEHPDGEIRGQLVPVQDVADALLDDGVRVPDGESDADDVPVADEDELDEDGEDQNGDDGEPDGDEEPDDDDTDEVITFVDCHTVRIVGDFPEIVIYPLELVPPGDQPGEPDDWFVGAMGSFPVGPVDGERTIDVEEEIGERTIISAVDVLDGPFTEGEAVHERIHPDRDECIEQLFVDAGVEPPDDVFGERPAEEPGEEPDETPNGEPAEVPDEDVDAAPNGEPNETEPNEEPDVTDGNTTTEDDT